MMVMAASNPILKLIRRTVGDQRFREQPDPELLLRFHTQQDKAAFHALLRRHGPMVLDVCCGVLGNEADAEDAFQATFLILARKAGSIRKTASLGSWLHGVAYRTALKARAQSAARQKHEARVPGRQGSEPDDLSWREVRQVLHDELSGLPERYRAPLVLCYLEGGTQEATAMQLGVAKSTLRERLERGRALLRTRLVRRGLGPAAMLVAAGWLAASASAGVPLSLIVSTVNAASHYAAGQVAVTGLVSVKVAALTEGVLRAMMMSKLKAVVAVVLVLGFIVTGATALTGRMAAAQGDMPATVKDRMHTLKRVNPREKQERHENDFTAWGKEIGGLQAGLGYHPGRKRAYNHGETIKVVLRVRNVGKEAVEFKHIWAFFVENPPVITDADGKLVQLPRVAAEGLHRPRNPTVTPGKEIELYEWEFDLRPKGESGKKLFAIHGTGQFSLQCERIVGPTSSNPVHPNPALSKLATGKLELEITEDPALFERATLKSDKELLRGTWVRVTEELAGEKRPDDYLRTVKWVVEFSGDKFRFQWIEAARPRPALIEGSFALDHGVTPKTITFTDSEKSQALGIYKVEGDRLTICGGPFKSTPRPAAFETKPGTSDFLAVFTRQKEQKPDDKPVPKGEGKLESAKPVIVRQDANLQRMAMSPDGEVLATVGVIYDGSTDGTSNNSTVKLWDARTGKLKQALDEEKNSHLEIAFSRDLLAIGVNGKLHDTKPRGPYEVRLLDAKTLALKHEINETLVPRINGVSALAFSPDGKRLAVAGSALTEVTHESAPFLKLWDAEKQRLIEGKPDLGAIPRGILIDSEINVTNGVDCLAFSPDGKLLATAWRDGNIRLYDGQTGEFRTLLNPALGPVEAGSGPVAFSSDSKTFASKGRDKTLVLWNLAEGKPRRTLKGHKGEVVAVAFSKDGRSIATGGATAKDYEIILWDAKTGEVKQTFPGLAEPVHAVAFSPDGKTMVVSGGWHIVEGKGYRSSGGITLFPLE
ncbi:MAG: sigma-70 family RNA polymerase sigma factor [Gemmataceae bacterium]|nr:sigma-70 family RNA polymerase sigma factor [Gemmataceae bacterium]